MEFIQNKPDKEALQGGFRERGEWGKKFRERGAWGQKVQEAGSKGNHFREQGATDSGHFIKQISHLGSTQN